MHCPRDGVSSAYRLCGVLLLFRLSLDHGDLCGALFSCFLGLRGVWRVMTYGAVGD